MIPSRIIIAAVFFASCFSGAAHAQNDFIKAELVTLSWKGNIKNLWFMGKEGTRKLDVYERDFTSPEEYTGSPVLKFYENEESLKLPPEDRPAPKAVVKFPAKGGKFLLIFSPKDPAEEGWLVRLIDNSQVGFPAGAYRFMNLTPAPFQVALDGKVTHVGANSLEIVRPARGQDVRDMLAQIGVGKTIAYSSIWGHREDRRTTVFVLGDPNARNGISVRRFYQAVLKEQAEP